MLCLDITPCCWYSTVGYSTIAPTQQGDVYHGQLIPIGYAKLGVEEVCQDYEPL
jgi:hypothetical protein